MEAGLPQAGLPSVAAPSAPSQGPDESNVMSHFFPEFF
jgi:hypothetical protein